MGQTKRRILVVDDETDIGPTLRVMLEKHGFAVDVLTDSTVALKNFNPDVYDLAILDIRMPKMSGFELYVKMKSVDVKIKVIFLTALTDFNEFGDFKKDVSPKLRERHFIQKPISDIQLLEQVYSILN
jgi:DNA-binding NtrC family response regulator